MAKTTIEKIEGRVFLAPTSAELCVRDPLTFEKLPMTGTHKVLSSYWQKRIDNNEVKILNEGVE